MQLSTDYSISSSVKPFCYSCNKENGRLQSCGRCRKVTYCSKECQKAHWPTHKLDCNRILSQPKPVTDSPVKTSLTPELFQFIQANRPKGTRHHHFTKEVAQRLDVFVERDQLEKALNLLWNMENSEEKIEWLRKHKEHGVFGPEYYTALLSTPPKKFPIVDFINTQRLKTIQKSGKPFDASLLEGELQKGEICKVLLNLWESVDSDQKMDWLQQKAIEGHALMAFEYASFLFKRTVSEHPSDFTEKIIEVGVFVFLGRTLTLMDLECVSPKQSFESFPDSLAEKGYLLQSNTETKDPEIDSIFEGPEVPRQFLQLLSKVKPQVDSLPSPRWIIESVEAKPKPSLLRHTLWGKMRRSKLDKISQRISRNLLPSSDLPSHNGKINQKSCQSSN